MDDTSGRRERSTRIARCALARARARSVSPSCSACCSCPAAAPPESVPLPVRRRAALARVVAGRSRARRAGARREPLPGAVRALGSAIRAFHALEAADAERRSSPRLAAPSTTALVDALRGEARALLELRAVQLEGFLAELAPLRGDGRAVRRARRARGGVRPLADARGVVRRATMRRPAPTALRVMFKHMWNALPRARRAARAAPHARRGAGPVRLLPLARAPLADDARGLSRSAARRARRAACAALDGGRARRRPSRGGSSTSRASPPSIRPTRPTTRAASPASAAATSARRRTAFRTWLRDHPEGPLALRAQNFLRAAAAADRVE